LRGLTGIITSTHQFGTSTEISKLEENKQLFIAIVVKRFI
tara:strand:+ start:1031 stop:1150 length:120 start_codon:yes stop_codon:yes gene_type:complete